MDGLLCTAIWSAIASVVCVGTAFGQTAQPAAAATEPPKSFIDPATGHRIDRLSDEPNSGPLYFNFNAYSPDGREMVYIAPDGLHVLNFETRASKLIAPNPAKPIGVGGKTRTLYYANPKDNNAIYAISLDGGTSKKVADMPRRGKVQSINCDETLVAGTYIEGDGKDYGDDAVNPAGLAGPMVQPVNKGKMMQDRLDAKLPLVLFTVNLQTGELKKLLHSTDWVNHLLFSPVEPTLLMYCHEGPWHQIDRIWTIRTDGSNNQLVHPRTMAMEIAGHEFWGPDGKTIWYDLQRPKGEDFILAAYNIETGVRRWYRMTRDEWSIHFNVTPDESLICGDGGDAGQVAHAKDGMWIELFRPELTQVTGTNDKSFVQPGVLHSERLVDMRRHNYKSEPNVRFSPDRKMVIFQSTMFGPSYLFGVYVDKAP